jgi:hypothetical protein
VSNAHITPNAASKRAIVKATATVFLSFFTYALKKSFVNFRKGLAKNKLVNIKRNTALNTQYFFLCYLRISIAKD